MRELPILFSTPMVQAIQADTKNQTRRTAGLEKVNENPNDWELTGIALLCKGVFGKTNYEMDFIFPFSNKKGETVKCKPRYQKDDRIWVKETWFYQDGDLGTTYKADYSESELKTKPNFIKWKSSLFMRKEYARTWLECTGVRCERLQDISEEDCINEGIEKLAGGYKGYNKNINTLHIGKASGYRSYISLWESINGKDSWLENPWVFIYDFKRIEK